MKIPIIKTLLLLFAILPCLTGRTQEIDPQKIKEGVESQNFIFNARYVNPQGGRTRFLTSSYHLTVRPDSLDCHLPYFGRAYSAPVNPLEGGIKFISTDFEYKINQRRKHRWEIQIRPKDVSDVQQLNLTIFDNGNTTLRVINTNRQPISFTGEIMEGKPIEKKGF